MKIVSPVDVFDFESGQWSSIAAPEPRLFGELAELGGKLYLAGGYWASKEGHFEPARVDGSLRSCHEQVVDSPRFTACLASRLEAQVVWRAGCCSIHSIAILRVRATWRSWRPDA